jgi:hypothetical protein
MPYLRSTNIHKETVPRRYRLLAASDVLQGVIASHLPINDTADLMQLTGVASGSLTA